MSSPDALTDKVQLLKLTESHKFQMASDPRQPIEIQRELAEDKNQRVLFALAKSTVHKEIIERLIEVGDVFVLLKIIENPHTPLDILEKLSKHRLVVVNNEVMKKISNRNN